MRKHIGHHDEATVTRVPVPAVRVVEVVALELRKNVSVGRRRRNAISSVRFPVQMRRTVAPVTVVGARLLAHHKHGIDANTRSLKICEWPVVADTAATLAVRGGGASRRPTIVTHPCRREIAVGGVTHGRSRSTLLLGRTHRARVDKAVIGHDRAQQVLDVASRRAASLASASVAVSVSAAAATAAAAAAASVTSTVGHGIVEPERRCKRRLQALRRLDNERRR